MKRFFFPLLLIALLATACQPAAVPPTVAPPTTAPATNTTAPTAPPTSLPPTQVPATAILATATQVAPQPSATPAVGAPTGTPLPVDLTPAQLAAVNALAGTLKIPAGQITLVSTEAVDWPDGCLGIALPGVTCVKGPVPGFRIKLSAGGRSYEYHTNHDGSSVLSTAQGFQPLRVAVRLPDDSVQIVDTGFGARGVSLDQGLLPMGGSVDGVAYVLDFKGPTKAQRVDASGATTTLPFVDKPNYGLAVWPGNGADKPRLAWASLPNGDPATVQLFIANVDGSSVTPVVTETIASEPIPYQLLPERWSADGQSLYFSREPSGIGGYIPFAGASSLYRYNLADGSVTELIHFKPSGGKFICLDDLNADVSLAVGHCADPKTIGVQTISGGAVQTITAPGTVTDFRLAGGARFSPDGSRVAFGLAKGDPTAEQGWLALSDSLSGQSNFLATVPGSYYTVVAWLNDASLLVQLNVLACNPVCTNSLWIIGSDGANLSKLTDGTFLTLVAGQ